MIYSPLIKENMNKPKSAERARKQSPKKVPLAMIQRLVG